MSQGTSCKCPESKRPMRTREWHVLDYKVNYSAFNGYNATPSDYSSVQCKRCLASWRTRAAFVESLPKRPQVRRPG